MQLYKGAYQFNEYYKFVDDYIKNQKTPSWNDGIAVSLVKVLKERTNAKEFSDFCKDKKYATINE